MRTQTGSRPTTAVPLGVLETIVGEIKANGPSNAKSLRRAVDREWDPRDAKAFDMLDVLDHMSRLGLVMPNGDEIHLPLEEREWRLGDHLLGAR